MANQALSLGLMVTDCSRSGGVAGYLRCRSKGQQLQMRGQQVEVNGSPAVIQDLPFLLREFPEGQGPPASAAAVVPADMPQDRCACHVAIDPSMRGMHSKGVWVIIGCVADAVVRRRSSAYNKCRNGLLHGRVRLNKASHSLWDAVFHHDLAQQDTTRVFMSPIGATGRWWMLNATYHRQPRLL